ncbi:MAG TPA: MlaD family protein [Thermoanaerobaculia bacterium]|jgi:phospholipid/cholesterol/gamma-HCH transport system substrate-binding protein
MNTAAKVGAFFLVALVLTGLLIWKIEDLKFGRVTGKTLSVQFDDVAGLKDKADVRMAGVLVGKVSRIRLVGGKALVDIDLTKDVELRQGASASIQSLGMLGDKYVELIPGPVGAPGLPAGTVLQGGAPVNFEQITRLARDIEVDVKDITRNLKESLGGALGEERLTGIVENVLVLSQELRKLLESNRANIDSTTENFREFSAQMTQLVDRIDRLVEANTGGVNSTVENAQVLTTKLQTTVDNMNAITGKINQGRGTVGNLVNSDETSRNLNDALVAVKEGVAGLTGALSSVKKLNLDLGLRSEYLTGPGKGKAYFTADIQPQGLPRFYRFELSSQPQGTRSESTTITTTTFPDGHTEVVRADKEEFKRNVAISAEVGYRLGNWIGRAGLIENTGGAGVDYLMLKDRLRFSADLWDFDRTDLNAHAKLTGRFYFSPSVFVTGGWDDLLNTKVKRDSLFLGAGVRWGDDNIKYLAGAAGSIR